MKNSTALILILIALGVFYTFVNPQYQRTKSLGAELEQYENVLDNVSALSETRDELMIKLADISPEDISRISKIVPDDNDIVKLALDLDTMASQYGISIRNVQVDSSSEDNTALISKNASDIYDRAVVSFEFVSNYQNFRSFMEDIERSLRVIDVRSINFRSTDSGFYEYTVAVETYWLKK